MTKKLTFFLETSDSITDQTGVALTDVSSVDFVSTSGFGVTVITLGVGTLISVDALSQTPVVPGVVVLALALAVGTD